MKELFLNLLRIANAYGNITSANMYSGGKHSYITVETKDGVYDISILKKDEEKENA